MQKTMICRSCNQKITANIRLQGNQSYCSKPDCQKQRKREWYANKLREDPKYAARQKACKRKWYHQRPGHAYQKEYRQRHPDYVATNRQQQRQRNHRRDLLRRASAAAKIVKIDASKDVSLVPATYKLRIVDGGLWQKIVKIDSLLVELSEYQRE